MPALNVDRISFDTLGERKGLIVEGAHAGVARLAGRYEHPKLGEIYVKQETKAEKNLVEWMFYQLAEAILPQSRQLDIFERMAPVVLITPHEMNNSLKDVYVGSVSHHNMDLLWKSVYAEIFPDKPIPEKRPQGFEHKYQNEIAQFVKKYNNDDPGFSMLPVLAVLGHHATHLGNLGHVQENGHSKMLFFDYGAAAMYNYDNTFFEDPKIKGTFGDKLAKQFLGVSKNYMDYYQPGLDSKEANKRLNNFYSGFQENIPAITASIRSSTQRMATMLDKKSFLQFAEFIGIKPEALAPIPNNQLAEAVSKFITTSIVNRINGIPALLQTITPTAEPVKTVSSTTQMLASLENKNVKPVNPFLKLLAKSESNDPLEGLTQARSTPVINMRSSGNKAPANDAQIQPAPVSVRVGGR